jgi:hypothetical protein
MATITIKDLAESRSLDREAMSAVKGSGGAPWVYGWIRPYQPDAAASFGTVVNFYQINNFADQMINQFQSVNVNNTAANSNIAVSVDENSANTKQR